MLLLDAQLFCAFVDGNSSSLGVLVGIFLDPATQNGVRAITVFIATVIITTASDLNSGHASLESLDALFDGLGRSIRGPIFFGKGRLSVELSRLGLDLPRQFVVALGTVFFGTLTPLAGGIRNTATADTARGIATRVLVLALLDLDGWVLHDERGELVAHVDIGTLATGLAVTDDVLGASLLDDDKLRLGVLARLAQDEFLDEDVEQLAQVLRIVRAVDDVTVVLFVESGLCAKLAAEELGRVRRGSAECACDIGHVRDDGLDAISFSFNFGGHDRHAVWKA